MYTLIQRGIALLGLLFFSPLLLVLYIVVKLDSSGPFLFRQQRVGRGKKPFWIYKIRTMRVGAERLQSRYRRLNEADGPVFKIRNDPRYTRVGKTLSHMALDELPQLFNVLLGDMALVGPRPLPAREANKVPERYSMRFSVLPGMTSPWVVAGTHQVSFKRWMELDCAYVKEKNVWLDMIILLRTVKIILQV